MSTSILVEQNGQLAETKFGFPLKFNEFPALKRILLPWTVIFPFVAIQSLFFIDPLKKNKKSLILQDIWLITIKNLKSVIIKEFV